MATSNIAQTIEKTQAEVQNETTAENTLRKVYRIEISSRQISFNNENNLLHHSIVNKNYTNLYDNEKFTTNNTNYTLIGKYIIVGGQKNINIFKKHITNLIHKYENRLANYRHEVRNKLNNLSEKLKSNNPDDMKVFREHLEEIKSIDIIDKKFEKIISNIKRFSEFINNTDWTYYHTILQIEVDNNEESFYACYDSSPRNTPSKTNTIPTLQITPPTTQVNTNNEEQQSKRIKIEN